MPNVECAGTEPPPLVTFYQRHGVVRAVQWHKLGDHPHVQPGIHSVAGLLDFEQAAHFSRRFVDPGDWIVAESDGKHVVVTDAEFRRNYKSV